MRLESSKDMGDPREMSWSSGTMELSGAEGRRGGMSQQGRLTFGFHTLNMCYFFFSFRSTIPAHPVIIFVVMEVIRYQRCLRKRALKAKL